MSRLPNFPKIPASVGGQAIPDFLNFEVVGPVKRHPLKEKFNFALKTSPLFGSQEGSTFDEGRLWHPIHSVEFTSDHGGLKSFRGHYHARSTRLVGRESSHKSTVKLEAGEHITGISGNADHYITNLTVHTSKRKVHVVKGTGGTHFEFHVPEDHQVVSFLGTETGSNVSSVGVVYQRRLESISDTSAIGDGPPPVLTGQLSQEWLDVPSQNAWAKNDMPTIEALRSKASQDLLPIYANIELMGDAAWVEVVDQGETYYVSYNETGVIWSYLPTKANAASADAPTKDVVVSIGSYSKTSNFLGISLYNWSSLPTTIISGVLALGFVFLVRPIIQTGLEIGIAAAANLLVEGLAAAGAESAAILVPASVASYGGLIIAGILGVALVIGCIALASIIFKQYFLIMNVYNFDMGHTWTTVQHYEDNSVVSNGSWKDQTITKFILAGAREPNRLLENYLTYAGNVIAPPGFNPVKTLDNVVTYLNTNFQNSSTFFQGLGEGIVLNRDDSAAGLAIKYIVHRFSDNQIGAQGIAGSGTTFDLGNYYNKGTWVSSKNCSTTAGGFAVSCYTPALGGASDDTYTYEVNIGLPPPTS